MLSSSDQSFPSCLDLLLNKHKPVRTVMTDYQIDITAKTQK